MYSYQSFPARAAFVEMLGPSLVVHVLVLLWLALVLTARAPIGVELYAVDLEPPRAAAPAPAKPPPATPVAPSPAPAVGAPAGVAPGGPVTASGGGVGLPAYVPPAAQAGRVLTAPESAGPGEAPVDFSVVQGSAERYAGGVTSARGTSKRAVYDARARDEGVAGVVGGTGTGGPAIVAPPRVVTTPRVDRSRPALPLMRSWQCAFPEQANVAHVDFARARVVVTVGTDGRARAVVVLSDPGNGFGAAARACALSQRYSAALDAEGNPRVATTAPITVTFTR